MMFNLQQITMIANLAGSICTVLVNLVLIAMTALKIKSMDALNKKIAGASAILGIAASISRVLTQPTPHNFGSSMMYASMSQYLPLPLFLPSVFLAVHAGLEAMSMSFIGMEFVHRHLLMKSSSWIKQEKNFGLYFAGYILFFGVFNGASLFALCRPDGFSDEYMRAEINETFGRDVAEFPRLVANIYGSKDGIRWTNVTALLIWIGTIIFQYTIMIYCSIKMRANLHAKIRSQSFETRLLEKQFSRFLIVQIIIPTIFLFPYHLFVMILPFLDLNIGIQSGLIQIPLSFYSAVNSIAFMWIMSEYSARFRELFCRSPSTSTTLHFLYPGKYFRDVL